LKLGIDRTYKWNFCENCSEDSKPANIMIVVNKKNNVNFIIPNYCIQALIVIQIKKAYSEMLKEISDGEVKCL
jgi:hypothetical protein